MKTSLFLAGLAINALAPIAVSAPSHASTDCESAVTDAGRKISATGAQVFRVEESAISGYRLPESYRNSNPQELAISLGNINTAIDANQAKKGENIMASPKFKLSVATSVLSACAQYKALTIKMWGTDWISTYFKMPSGAIKEASCLPAGASGGKDLMWGYQVCF
ncbi:MAG: hypothetical protein VKI39_07625 [Synechococcus sp.]|nr:hypothetical protein [Synechococcus sp.]